jgi:CubicO group peptidase (beta-lactamase class C family)
VIEKASGRDYYDYMDHEVFAKAGVAAGFLRNTENERSNRGFALGYTPDGGDNWSILPARGTPAGGTYATAPDLLSFHKALATGALTKPETLKRLVLAPPPVGQTSPGVTSGVFAGDDVGASAVFGMTPAGHTVIVLANVGEAAQPVAARILKLLAGN